MPGILPMKVIKVGTTAQSRIAQACDRCRSKKIRCDGFRPTCTQCSNVGFECKTSDKLSRRAFPRGYTESLEERVRALEGEVRELKDLLDERDEKIDMLSKMHDQSSHRNGSRRASSASMNDKRQSQESLAQEKEEKFKLQQSLFLLESEHSDSYFVGTSSVRTFIDAFKRKLQESGKPCSELNANVFFPPVAAPSSRPLTDPDLQCAPPRVISDQMVNIFFQEWAPLFPVLHRPSFLTLYEQFVSGTEQLQEPESLAQLNLVFCIAAQSNGGRMAHDTTLCERQWMAAMESFHMKTSLTNLQCFLLAQIYCIQKGDAGRLLHYKGLAVSTSQRLGLHLSQKRFALGALTVETRKKVFWTMYTLDCFSAASLGLPMLLKEEDIHCEYPVDYDDEYVTEKGFMPTLPGEFTKLSSALALFRGSRILSKVLAANYPAAATHEISLGKIASLDEELEEWSDNLAPHLKLEFVQDKPSTHIISSRCPLISLTYNYIRSLIHRPAVCANLGDKAASSREALGSANKKIIQIIQLLDERKLSFSHCLSKNEILLLSGTGFLYQSLGLNKDGKLMKDSQRLICTVIDKLQRQNAPGASEFKQLGCSMLSIGCVSPSSSKASLGPKSSSKKSSSTRSEGQAPRRSPVEGHKQLAELAARYTLAAGTKGKMASPRSSDKGRLPTSMSSLSLSPPESCSGRQSEKSLRLLAPPLTPSQRSVSRDATKPGSPGTSRSPRMDAPSASPSLAATTPNLDFFSFPGESSPPPATRKSTAASESSTWERILTTLQVPSCLDEDSMYDWPGMEMHVSQNGGDGGVPVSISAESASESISIWSPETWTISGSECLSVPTNPTQSVLSLSDETGDELGGGGGEGRGKAAASAESESFFQSITIPQYTPDHLSPMSGVGEAEGMAADGEI